ncbi:hypothetical protein Q7P35_001855 [Cladosporium inversicolor]
MHIECNLIPGFNFLSGNSVRVELRIGSISTGPELISKDDHELKQPDSSSGFHWGRVQLAEASLGMVITLTRGTKARYTTFAPLSGEEGKPYIIETGCQVLKPQLGGAVGPEDGHSGTLQGNNPVSERATNPSQPRVKHAVKELTEQEESVKSTTDVTASKSHPSADGENNVLPTPSTGPGTPNHRSDTRNAAEAFGSKQTDGDKGIKLRQFRPREAEARLDVLKARFEQVASEVGQDNIAYLQARFNKAKGVHVALEAELMPKAAVLGDKKDTEDFKLQTRKAEAHWEVVKAEGKLLAKTLSQDLQNPQQ